MFRVSPIREDIHEMIDDRSVQLNIPLPDNYQDYTCSITYLMMFDPVTTQCGHVHERTAIEEWEAKQREQKPEHPPTCDKCREPIGENVPNRQLKREIDQFLKNTLNQLEQKIRTHPDDENNPSRQQLIPLIQNFLKYGNDPAAFQRRLEATYKEFREQLAKGNLKKAAIASAESSEATSRHFCTIL